MQSKVMAMSFELRKRGEVEFLIIPSFEATGLVRHAFSTRKGGFSVGHCGTLNLGFNKGDDRKTVLRNYKVFCDAVGIDIKNLVASHQIHESDVYVAGKEDRGKGILKKSDITGKDALITRESNVALVTYYADCVPLFFLDPETPAVGLAHAGWRGTVKKIGMKTVKKMIEEFKTPVEKLLCGIGPCISGSCYEVDDPVVEIFKDTFEYWEDLVEYKGNGHWLLDLVKANKKQLEEVGVKSENVTVSGFCTHCRPDLFYSYRRDKGMTGSLAAVIELK
ncbi:MAG: purine-nucleoside/S-methyl-5-thioadenosine phosphorylase / adenosine deaminase [Tepidanaerobacteraceae bacterium]|nr:purine-nucleoside/S-methyl-5-thioadenosine phosphorylase / adenosine deaminase [Tepidanaerobacteraceae bacterium]